MKKVIIICIVAALFSACDKDSHSSDPEFKIQPGDLTAFNSPATSYDTNLGDSSSATNPRAIIYNGTINGTSYVGIAISDNANYPNATQSLNLKIYFEASSIPDPPSSISLTSAGNGLKIIYYNGTVTSDITADLILNFTSKTTGTTYTTYTITGTGSGSLSLITNIVATKVGS